MTKGVREESWRRQFKALATRRKVSNGFTAIITAISSHRRSAVSWPPQKWTPTATEHQRGERQGHQAIDDRTCQSYMPVENSMPSARSSPSGSQLDVNGCRPSRLIHERRRMRRWRDADPVRPRFRSLYINRVGSRLHNEANQGVLRLGGPKRQCRLPGSNWEAHAHLPTQPRPLC